MNVCQLGNKINDLLSINLYEPETTGAQVVVSDKEIRRIAVAVDSGASIIEKAHTLNADALLVHHGLFWGHTRIEGVLSKRVHTLFKTDISLLAYHLPLDGDLTYGNNALVAKHIGLKNLSGFVKSHEAFVGVKGEFDAPLSLQEISNSFKAVESRSQPLALAFGKEKIKTAGIITGSGSGCIFEASALGLDLLISGEPKQSVYHDAKDLRINCLFLGHYYSETFGVRALGDYIQKNYNIESVFIDEPMSI